MALRQEIRPAIDAGEHSFHWVERIVRPGFWNLDRVEWWGDTWHPRWEGTFTPANAGRCGWSYIKEADPPDDPIGYPAWHLPDSG
jgi:hypothetical protein